MNNMDTEITILIIDDEPLLRGSLSAFLIDSDYHIIEAENGQKGLDMLIEKMPSVDAVLVDLNMPVMDGYEFIEKASKLFPEIPIIALSGVGVVDQAIRALHLGAWDFISKPMPSMTIVSHTLDKTLERAMLLEENRRYQVQLEKMVQLRTRQLDSARRQIMQRLSRAAEYKDNETGYHVIRVGEISAVLGRALNLNEERCALLKECAPLHDVGKIGIPDAVLLKPGKLNKEEWEIMKKHCEYGYDILGPLLSSDSGINEADGRSEVSDDDNIFLQLARDLALNHHEQWMGTGYPRGLKGEEIPIEARIVSLVDVFDALRSERPYKQAFPIEKCISIIREGSGTSFDPKVVSAFEENIDLITNIYDNWKDSLQTD